MAHYAFLDENNVVVDIIKGIDETELIDGLTPEQWYENFRGMKCRRTSINTYRNQHKEGGTPFRKNYAFIGGTYDEEKDAFISPKPNNFINPYGVLCTFIFNEEVCDWDRIEVSE